MLTGPYFRTEHLGCFTHLESRYTVWETPRFLVRSRRSLNRSRENWVRNRSPDTTTLCCLNRFCCVKDGGPSGRTQRLLLYPCHSSLPYPSESPSGSSVSVRERPETLTTGRGCPDYHGLTFCIMLRLNISNGPSSFRRRIFQS